MLQEMYNCKNNVYSTNAIKCIFKTVFFSIMFVLKRNHLQTHEFPMLMRTLIKYWTPQLKYHMLFDEYYSHLYRAKYGLSIIGQYSLVLLQ